MQYEIFGITKDGTTETIDVVDNENGALWRVIVLKSHSDPGIVLADGPAVDFGYDIGPEPEYDKWRPLTKYIDLIGTYVMVDEPNSEPVYGVVTDIDRASTGEPMLRVAVSDKRQKWTFPVYVTRAEKGGYTTDLLRDSLGWIGENMEIRMADGGPVRSVVVKGGVVYITDEPNGLEVLNVR